MPRPHKGHRYPRTIRLPLPLNTTIEQAAAAAGYDNVNDYMVDTLALAHKAGVHPKPRNIIQERLPLGA
jgi:hypothetical protein